MATPLMAVPVGGQTQDAIAAIFVSDPEAGLSSASEVIETIYSLTRCERDRYAELGIDSPYVQWGIHPELLETAAKLRGDGYDVLLAGGLGPENVKDSLAAAPAGLDVCRGVEAEPGRKDPALLLALGKEVHP